MRKTAAGLVGGIGLTVRREAETPARLEKRQARVADRLFARHRQRRLRPWKPGRHSVLHLHRAIRWLQVKSECDRAWLNKVRGGKGQQVLCARRREQRI